LAIALSVLFSLGHYIICPFFSGQEKKGQIIQWPREKRTDNAMAKRRKDRQYYGRHCIICPFFSCPLYYLSFFLLAIVLSFLFSLGHCIMSFFLLAIALSVLFSLGHYIVCPFREKRTDNTMAKRKKDR
jgi:uncharacterized Tic20 family protein